MQLIGTWNIYNTGKRYTYKPCDRVFITFGKEANHTKSCGDSTQAYIFEI